MNIDWHSDQNHVMLNPRLPEAEQRRIREMLASSNLKGHVWVSTSGSTGQSKWTGLSKEALIVSAAAVNDHLQATSKDIWINPLPDFHVGGIGIEARSLQSGASAIPCKWDPIAFHHLTHQVQATLSALVPAQVYDLVIHQLPAPASLRAIIVGGGALPEELYDKAIAMGWKLLPSYGLTECASQVATAPIVSSSHPFPRLQTLRHLQVSTNAAGFICLKGPSLLTCYAMETSSGLKFIDPKSNGWFQTEDLGQIDNGFLKIFGRSTHFVKIGGESVDLLRLQNILEGIRLDLGLTQDIALIAVPDARLGHVLHLATDHMEKIDHLLDLFEQKVLPFERIRKTHLLKSIPRSSMGKLQNNELLKVINLIYI